MVLLPVVVGVHVRGRCGLQILCGVVGITDSPSLPALPPKVCVFIPGLLCRCGRFFWPGPNRYPPEHNKFGPNSSRPLHHVPGGIPGKLSGPKNPPPPKPKISPHLTVWARIGTVRGFRQRPGRLGAGCRFLPGVAPITPFSPLCVLVSCSKA